MAFLTAALCHETPMPFAELLPLLPSELMIAIHLVHEYVLEYEFMVQAQEISLNFHCKCEQFVNFAEGTFFNFNGTAGGTTIGFFLLFIYFFLGNQATACFLGEGMLFFFIGCLLGLLKQRAYSLAG